MSGVSPKNIVGKKSEEIGLPKKFVENWNKVLQNVIKTGKIEKGEFNFSYLEGYEVYQYVIVPEFSVKSGDVETVLSLIKDITESKKLGDALAESEQKYRTIVETAAEGIVIAKLDGTHIFVNNRLAQMFGYSTDELLKKSSFELMSKDEQRRQAVQMRKSLENDRIQYREFEFLRKDGSVLWAACNASPLFDENGKHVANISLFSDITERKKTEDALKESEQRYHTLFSNMEEGFFLGEAIVDKNNKPVDYRFLEANNGFEKQSGLKINDILGKTAKQALPNLEPSWIEIYGKVALTGQSIRFEKYNEDTKKCYEVYSFCPTTGQFASIFTDITERKKAEEKLRKSEAEYSSLFGNMIDGFIYCQMIFDYANEPVDFVHLQVNDAFEKITGLKRDFVIGKKVTQAILGIKEANPELFEIYGRVALTGQKEKFEVFFKPLSLWLNISVYSPAKGYFGAVLEDITERKKMEQARAIALAESKRRGSEISALLNASRAVLENKEFQDSARAIFDGAKELIGATAGYVALLTKDGKQNEVLFLDSGGLPCTVDPSLPMPIRGLRAEAYSSGETVVENDFSQSEWKKFMPDGHVQLKNVLFAPLMIDQRVVGVIGLANKPAGFTKRDREMAMAFGEIAYIALANSRMLEMLEENEKELKTYSEHLEALVEERTKKLRDSERLAAIGETAGMVGHDIRNPLQSITGELYLARTSLESLPDTHEKEDVKESIGYIEEQLIYVNKIVQDLQDFAKTAKPAFQETDLEKTVQDVLSSMNIPETITVSSNIGADFPKINIDPLFLKRILTNLTSNATQAITKGGKITITATCKDNKVSITVADTGQGITDDVKDKLFKPLFTTKAKGQGLGLAIVKKLTEALNGKVTVESQIGKGTQFTVEFPIS